MVKRLVVILLVAALAVTLRPAAPARAQDDVSWLLSQINNLRGGLGLAPYALNGQLSAAATAHSEYMANSCDFSHTEANGSTPQSRAAAYGYPGDWISENIYGGSRAQASNAWTFWVNSPVHYHGLTHNVDNEVGIGVARGSCGQAFTLLFGHRGDAAAPAAAPAPAEGGGPDAPPPPPPTQKPNVPPPPTRTPTATIPTLTPSATWTITPTHLPTTTATMRPPTSTPLSLPTVPALGQQTASPIVLAMLPVSTATASVTPSPTASSTPIPTLVPQAVHASSDGFSTRDLLPFALLGPAMLLGLAGVVYWRRVR